MAEFAQQTSGVVFFREAGAQRFLYLCNNVVPRLAWSTASIV